MLKNSLMREGWVYVTERFCDLLLQLSCSFGKAQLGFSFFISLVSPKSLTKANSTRERERERELLLHILIIHSSIND